MTITLRFFTSRFFVAGALALWGTTAQAWWNHDWAYRKQVTLDAAAAGVSGELADAVVLVRLHEGVLRFTDVAADGADLRFVAEDDKTPLKFHIEKFDPVFNLGFVWLQVPKLAKGAPVKVWMYYGNPKAVQESSPKDSYGPEQKLVYHFAERGSPAQDATAYRNNAVTASAVDESGLIGNAVRFDGSTVVVLPASQTLNITTGGTITWSAWVKPAAPEPRAVIYAQRDAGRIFVIGLNAGAPFVGLADGPGPMQISANGPAIADNAWHHLAVVTSAAQTSLFVDGQQGPGLPRGLPSLAGTATLGGQGGVNGQPIESPFHGEVDELKIAGVARDPAILQLEAKNQGPADKLVGFGADEVQSSWSTGYVGIILGSVTLDGWVVIGALIVMMLVSWVVMFRKAIHIGRVHKGNALFLSTYQRARGNFAKLRAATLQGQPQTLDLSQRSADIIEDAPLLHMFKAGLEELEGRFASSAGAARRRAYLSEQSIEAIRATLDATLIREQQALSRSMVLLTIAISGGPFIGLLGTVMGVMITFAGVAAAGDVNINAIAPGISAALAATVAGLLVAIPSLFGYNYLITRIKECTADMQVFVDSFITRLAESYGDSEALESAARG